MTSKFDFEKKQLNSYFAGFEQIKKMLIIIIIIIIIIKCLLLLMLIF